MQRIPSSSSIRNYARLSSYILGNIFNNQSELHLAAGKGDTRRVEFLIKSGIDINEQDRRGDTPLHLAALHSKAETAGCLLANGADFTIKNKKGVIPLDPRFVSNQSIHAIRQCHRRYRTFEWASREASSERVNSWLHSLNRDGFIKITGLIAQDSLLKLNEEFNSFISALEKNLKAGNAVMRHYDEEEHWWPEDQAYVTNNAFKYSPELIRFSCHPELIELANLYLGRMAHITRAVGMRYLPAEARDNHMFGWHHDMEEKRLKMQILLTDVSENDQYMSYVAGSHQLFHPYEMFKKNCCSLEYCRRRLGDLRILKATGMAGDIFLFDSNGAHRGNRRPNAKIRDVFFLEYNVETGDIWGGDINRTTFSGMSFPYGNPLEKLMLSEKKWTNKPNRKFPTWIENLWDTNRWLN